MVEHDFSLEEMDKVYTVYKKVDCDDCEFCEAFDYCKHQASCNVTFHERFTDDDQHWLHLEYHLGSNEVFEMNWENFKEIVRQCEFNIDELNIIRKTLDGNWKVELSDGIYFSCHHEISIPEEYYWESNFEGTVDLGRIAECYDDCDKCTKCHNWSMNYDTQYEKCRYCDGCHEHPCTKVNGRKTLLDAKVES